MQDNPLAQKTSTQYYMNTFLCFMWPDDTPASISNSIVRKINEYSSDRNNNMKYFRYHAEVTETLGNENLHALDYWVITSDVVDTVNNVYDDELNDGTFLNILIWLMPSLKGLKIHVIFILRYLVPFII